MQPPRPEDLSRVPALLQQQLCPQACHRLWGQVEPRRYPRLLEPWTLALVVLGAFLTRLSGLRAILACHGQRLRVSSLSTLSAALSSKSFLAFLRALAAHLEAREDWSRLGERDLVAVDTTWITLPATQRTRGLGKVSGDAVGLGAMFALRLDGHLFPLRLLAVLPSATSDTKPVRLCRLLAAGPTYVLDRGFYSMTTVAHWMRAGVRFIARAKAGKSLRYEVKKHLGGAGARVRGLRVLEDAVVLLGSPQTRAKRSLVRLVRACHADGEEVVLVTGHLHWSAAQVLDAYRRRWEVEDFFNFLKEQLGLAHLYSFSATGVQALLAVAMLGVGLLLELEAQAPASDEKAPKARSKTVAARLRRALGRARARLGVLTAWKPNTTRRWTPGKNTRGKPGRIHGPRALPC